MGIEAATPPGFWERVRQMVRDEVGKLLRSGLLRSASIGEGGLTIRGGFLRLLSGVTDVVLFYVGPSGGVLGDGTRQQVWIVKRSDGTNVLDLYDAFPDPDGTLQQALNWRDRGERVVFADDTNSGQGLARPWLPGVLYPSRYGDMTESTTAATDVWETVLQGEMPKQQPRLQMAVRASMDTSGATGQVQVLVNGAPLGTPKDLAFAVGAYVFGPAEVAGEHMSRLLVEVQVRRRTGTGGVRAGGIYLEGRQS